MPALLGDIGATNARFALLDAQGRIDHVRIHACGDHAGLAEAAEAYLAEVRGPAPEAAAIDVAGPVSGDEVALTNHPWSFSQAALRRRLALQRLLVVNDFAAVAAAAPHIPAAELSRLGGGGGTPGAPIGVLGPGSGLGAGGIVPIPGGAGERIQWIALPGEGGHVSLAPGTARESRVLEAMHRRFGRVSAERALSGPGLVNLYAALCEIDGMPAQAYAPSQITDPEIGERDPRCAEALAMFADLLGAVAGDLALTLGARGGIYIAGGIVPRLGTRFAGAAFRRRFEDKGRMSPYLAPIPAYVIRHPHPAFVGLAALLQGDSTIAG